MGKKLYVGNLSYHTTQSELEAHFAQVGDVIEAVVVQDRETGRSRGFGFVEMADERSANAAIEQLNGRELDGRALNVAEARPPQRREGGRGDGRGEGRGRSDRSDRSDRW
ncbi:MAG: RNA-binding protein [Anaerolineae bacterium]|nr:RNA-binding protein [Anaerolineae bacterium]